MALAFNAANPDYITIPANAVSLVPTTGITLSCYFNVSTTTTIYNHFFCKAAAGTWVAPYAVWALRTQAALPGINCLLGWINDPTVVGNTVPGTTTIALNVWHHGAFTYNGSTLAVYLDGKVDGTKALSATINTSTFPLYLGCATDKTTGDAIHGNMADCAIWNTALSDVEIYALAKGVARPDEIRCGSLMAYWPFSNDDGGVVVDKISQIVGMPTGTSLTADPPLVARNRIRINSRSALAQGNFPLLTMQGTVSGAIFGYTNSPMGSIRRIPNIIGY